MTNAEEREPIRKSQLDAQSKKPYHPPEIHYHGQLGEVTQADVVGGPADGSYPFGDVS